MLGKEKESFMPHPSAWTKIFFPGENILVTNNDKFNSTRDNSIQLMSKIFCPGQSIFVLGQNYFVCADGSGISQLISKSNALSFWIGQNILSKDKKICPMDKLFFVQRKNNFFMDKIFCPVQKDGACIYVKLLEAKISRRSRAKLQNYHRGLQKGRNLVVNDNLNKQVKTKH